MWDIDYEYEKYLEALVEEQYQASLTQKDLDADRYDMWGVILGEVYSEAKKNKKKKLKEWFTRTYGLKPHNVTWDWAHEHDCPVYKEIDLFRVWPEKTETLETIRGFGMSMIVYDDIIPVTKLPQQTISFSNIESGLKWAQPCPPVKCCTKPKEEKETTMGNDYNMEVDQRNHLKRRAESVRAEKYSALREKFYMDTYPEARTKDEILAALKRGEVEFEEYYFDKDGKLKSDSNLHGVFILKNTKKDAEGFKAAEKLLGKAYTNLKDAIIVKPLADGLAALNEFETKEF